MRCWLHAPSWPANARARLCRGEALIALLCHLLFQILYRGKAEGGDLLSLEILSISCHEKALSVLLCHCLLLLGK